MRKKLEFGNILILAVLARPRSSVRVQRGLVRDVSGFRFWLQKTGFTEGQNINPGLQRTKSSRLQIQRVPSVLIRVIN